MLKVVAHTARIWPAHTPTPTPHAGHQKSVDAYASALNFIHKNFLVLLFPGLPKPRGPLVKAMGRERKEADAHTHAAVAPHQVLGKRPEPGLGHLTAHAEREGGGVPRLPSPTGPAGSDSTPAGARYSSVHALKREHPPAMGETMPSSAPPAALASLPAAAEGSLAVAQTTPALPPALPRTYARRRSSIDRERLRALEDAALLASLRTSRPR